ncbi:MAG: transglycosylase domain-containing protein [Alphaproteobacteria bacterium]|nr:transglycosylase domain-containing protein [Alphaproteobacteria bacterium]
MPRLRALLRWTLRLTALLVGVGLLILVIWGLPFWRRTTAEVRKLADAHTRYELSHPNWSFPARVWSAPAPLDQPRERLLKHARIRAYEEVCPPERPGQICPSTGEVLPRGGRFPEGVQPEGLEGWSRELALEPVLLGWLIGPDGELREHLPVEEAPEHLLAALIAAEDQAFMEHGGIKLTSIVRAAWANLRGVGVLQGGSTLTMQAVRILRPRTRGRTLTRKAWETVAALELDRHLGKQGVLQVYLDGPYLGQSGNLSVCGFQAAAWHYFGVDARDLTLAQAATLTSILPAPGKFNPITSPEVAKERRDRTLRRMGEAGWDVTEALAEPIEAEAHPWPGFRYPAYLQATRAWAEDRYATDELYGAGLELHTALDVVAQEEGEAVIAERLTLLLSQLGRHYEQPLRAAAALVDPALGALVAVNDSGLDAATDFSRATQARRQVGSAFKPMVFALAFDQSYPVEGAPAEAPYSAARTLPNSWRNFKDAPDWHPRNVGGFYSATVSLAYALAWSQNIATASLLEELGGPERLIALVRRMGITAEHLPAEPGLALGQAELSPWEMARLVATFINGGRAVEGGPVLWVKDPTGRARYRRLPPSERVLSEEAATLTRAMMELVINWGTGGAARGAGGLPGVEGPAVGKTGTTDMEKDLWFVGGTPHHAGALWIGFDQPASVGASASDLAAPLWGWWMRAVSQDLPPADFQGAPLRRRAMCAYTGCSGAEGECVSMVVPFLEGTGPRPPCEDLVVEEKEKREGIWTRHDEEEEEDAEEEAAAPGGWGGG